MADLNIKKRNGMTSGGNDIPPTKKVFAKIKTVETGGWVDSPDIT